MLVSFTFRITRECQACKISLPLNGISAELRCYHCGEVNPQDASFWTYVIERAHFASALGFQEGEASESRVMSRLGNYVYAYGKRTPRCQVCKGPDLVLDALQAEAADDGRCFCPACGQSIRLRPADDLVRAINDRAVLVVGETTGDATMQARTKIHVFACMGCGGGLKVDGSRRSVECEYCKAANYLPDGLWNEINPVPKPHAWFLVCDYDDASMRTLRWSDDKTRAADAATAPLSAEEFEQLSRDGESQVRAAVAGNPACPPAILERLAYDRDGEVMPSAAGNPHTPLQALIDLAAQSEQESVWQALCSHVGQHAPVIEQLAQHHRYGARVLAAGHPALSLATLHKLAKDDDSDVQKAARARLDALRGQGVDVDAGRGFFAKLFGAVVVTGLLVGCYSGNRASRDINASWRGHTRAQIEARWGKAMEASDANDGDAPLLVWRRVDQHVELPSAEGHAAIGPTGFDIHFEAEAGKVWTTNTDVIARLDGAGNVADVIGPSIYLQKGPPRGTNMRWGFLFGFHAGMGMVAGADTPLPSLGLYMGGMLGPRLGLVGAYQFVNGNDPDGYAMGMSWAVAAQYWPIDRLWLRAGPAFVVDKDPVDGGEVDVGVATGASFALIRGRVFVLDLRLDATVATGVAFGSAGVGVNIN